jgi:hypothetical protein
MNRRQFLTAGSTGCLASLTGCTALDLPVPGLGGHPFADSTVGVRVEDRGTTSHDVEANARETLAFWAAESSQYVGFEIDFEIVAEQPEIVLAYVDSSEDCSDVENYSSDVLGCAPLIRPGNRISRPVTAYVVAAKRPFGSIRTTAKHEIGHILGLGHDDEPKSIMSNRPADRIPLYEIRVDIWETVVAGYEEAAAAAQRLNAGISAWNDEAYDTAITEFGVAKTGFVDAKSEFETARERTAELEVEPPLETVDLPTLQDGLDTQVERMAAAGDVASTMVEASEAAGDNDRSTAQQLSSAASDRLEAFHAIIAPESRTFAVGLGLVRGVDREDAGVTVGDDEL